MPSKPPIPPMPEPVHACGDECLTEELAAILQEYVDPELDEGAKVVMVVRWPDDPGRFIVVGNDELVTIQKIAEAVKKAVKRPSKAESWQ